MNMNDDVCLIWSNEHRGWWRQGSAGYTRNLRAAGHYSAAEAVRICADAVPTAAHIGCISEIPVRFADIMAVMARYPHTIPREIVEERA